MKREFFFLLLSRALAGLASAYAAILLARDVGPQIFGTYGAVVSSTTVIMTFAGLGLPTLISKQRATRDPAISQTLRLNTTFLLLGTVPSGIIAGILSRDTPSSLLALIMIVIAISTEAYIDSILSIPIADGAKWTVGLNILLRRVVLLVAIFFTIAIDSSRLLGYAVGQLAGAILATLLGARYLRLNHVSTERVRDLKDIFRTAWPYALSNGSAASRSLDTFIVASTVGTTGAGYYMASTRLTNPFYLIPSAFTQVLMPHAAKSDGVRARNYAFRIAMGTVLSYIVISPIAIFSQQIAVLLLGSDYADAAPVLTWTLFAMPVVALASPLGTLLQSQNQERFVGNNGLLFAGIGLCAMMVAGAAFHSATAVAATVFATFAAKCVSLFIRAMRTL